MHLLLQDLNNMDMKSAAVGAAFGAALMVIVAVVGFLALIMVICHWMIYSKAGKPGWAAIVPIYNIIVLLEIVGKPLWWLVLMLIPIVNIVIFIMVLNQLSKSFGQGAGFTVGLLFVPIVFYPLLAFSKNIKYVGPGGIAAATPQA
jgi:hypothetical protein